jgi:hypothetical protein
MSGVIEQFDQFIAWPSESGRIDLTVTGSYSLGSGESYRGDFFPVMAIFVMHQASNISVGATISFGTNSPNFDNILPPTVINPLINVANLFVHCRRVNRTAEIFMRVSQAATGVGINFQVRPLLFGLGWTPN